MQTTTYAHFSEEDRHCEAAVRTRPNGDRYIVVKLGRTETSESVEMFFHGTDLLDKLANEIERATREFVGDVPEPLHMTGQFCECAECAP